MTAFSYAGMISSTDDFYLLSSGLAIMETTLNVIDNDAYEEVANNKYMPVSWMRAMVANRLSTTAEEWVATFNKKSSETYSCTWMVLDMNKVKESVGQDNLAKGSLVVLETLPGFHKSEDMSAHISSTTYFASYNIPYFCETRKYGKYTQAGENRPDCGIPQGSFCNAEECRCFYSYDSSGRGCQSRNMHDSITNVETMKIFMRHNDFLGSSSCDHGGEAQISGRYDVNPTCSSYHLYNGAIDAKVSSFATMNGVDNQPGWSLAAYVINGPTSSEGQTPFEWGSVSQASHPHYGMPDKWDFTWEILSPHHLVVEL